MAVTGHLSGTMKFTAQGDAITDMAVVRYLRWVSKDAVAGQALLVQDSNGDVLFASVATGSNFVDVQAVKKWVPGLTMAALPSGTLYAIME